MSYPPNQPPPGPGWGGQDPGGWAPQPGPEQGGWAPQPGADQGWAPGPGQAPPGPPQQWSQPGYGTPPPGMPGGAPAPKKSSPVLPIAIIVVLIAAAAGAFFVFAGGDDDGGNPESVATSYVNALIDRDCGAMSDLVNLEGQGTSADQIRSECEAEVNSTDEDVSEFLPTELVSTRVVTEEGDAATVSAEVRLGNGETTTQDLDMSRIDGDWRVNVDPSGNTDEPTDDTIPPPDDEPDDTTTTSEQQTTTTESTTTTTAGTEDPEDLANRDACAGGDMAACDDLWLGTPVGSELEAFAETCGGRGPEGGYENTCESTFG